MGSQQVASGDDPHDFTIGGENRQATDFVDHHLIGGIAQCRIDVCHDRSSLNQFTDGFLVGFGRIQKMPPGNNSDQPTTWGNNRKALVAAVGAG